LMTADLLDDSHRPIGESCRHPNHGAESTQRSRSAATCGVS
jgi:hypothetical protein